MVKIFGDFEEQAPDLKKKPPYYSEFVLRCFKILNKHFMYL